MWDPCFFVHSWPKHQLVSSSLYIHPHITQQPLLSFQQSLPLHYHNTNSTLYPRRDHPFLIPNDTHRHWDHIYPNSGIKIALSCQSRSRKLIIIVKKHSRNKLRQYFGPWAFKTASSPWVWSPSLACLHILDREDKAVAGALKCNCRDRAMFREKEKSDVGEYWGLGDGLMCG